MVISSFPERLSSLDSQAMIIWRQKENPVDTSARTNGRFLIQYSKTFNIMIDNNLFAE